MRYIVVRCETKEGFVAARRALHDLPKEHGLADMPYMEEKRTAGLTNERSLHSWQLIDQLFTDDVQAIKAALAESRRPKITFAICGVCHRYAATRSQMHWALRRFIQRKGWKIRDKVFACERCATKSDTGISIFDPNFRKIWSRWTFAEYLVPTEEKQAL